MVLIICPLRCHCSICVRYDCHFVSICIYPAVKCVFITFHIHESFRCRQCYSRQKFICYCCLTSFSKVTLCCISCVKCNGYKIFFVIRFTIIIQIILINRFIFRIFCWYDISFWQARIPTCKYHIVTVCI